MYVLKRTDQGGGFVAKSGHCNSYTNDIRFVRIFNTKEDAEKNRCVKNEIVVTVNSI